MMLKYLRRSEIATVTSTPGNDIKEVTKPFLDYLDDSNSMVISFDDTNFLVRLTDRVQFKTVRNETHFFKANEINGKSELTPVYLKESLRKQTAFTFLLKRGQYQILSPVLFCSQVQLDGNEFQEIDGVIKVNTTAFTTSVNDYIRVDDSHLRICVDEYLQGPGASSGTRQNPQTISLLCIIILCKYCYI